MFTGLVEDTGSIVAVDARSGATRLSIRTRIPLAEVKIGDSIAVDGVCLTAERLDGDVFVATAGPETLARTTLSDRGVGSRVHLERAMRVGDRLGGHIVQGHVDGVGRVATTAPRGDAWSMHVDVPTELARFVAEKGSITLDGLSLTVNEIHGVRLRVDLVPHTRAVTALGERRPGDRVNVEVDVLAKYVERLLSARDGGITAEFLERHGFLK